MLCVCVCMFECVVYVSTSTTTRRRALFWVSGFCFGFASSSRSLNFQSVAHTWCCHCARLSINRTRLQALYSRTSSNAVILVRNNMLVRSLMSTVPR